MLFLRSWLEEYINLKNISDSELENLITSKCSEVDGVTVYNDYFNKKVVVGKITNVRKHQEADKLNVFDVIISSELESTQNRVQIVSAATNVKDGLYIPVALVGAKLPFLNILPRKLRGIESEGMCCGKSELGLETEPSEGLWELEQDLESEELEKLLGSSICHAFPRLFPVQTVFDIKILPDKVSAIGCHLGMALELSYILEDGQERLTEIAKNLTDEESINQQFESLTSDLNHESKVLEDGDQNYEIELEDENKFANKFNLYDVRLEKACILDGDKQIRMLLLEQNLVGGFADFTNYVLLDVGQPSHAYDLETLI